jgi:ribosome biogenesis GTPase / thiamine phosphate phosphatase
LPQAYGLAITILFQMQNLEQYGWNDFHQKFFNQYPEKGLSAGRVISIHGFRFEIVCEKGIIDTELSGKLMFTNSSEDLPKVGDWVVFMDYGDIGFVIDVFPRLNALTRKNPGEKTQVQVLATNIDAALVVQGLDRDFNVMRVERYLVQLASCGIRPVVILNKTDLVTDPEAYRNEILKLQRDCSLHLCSTYTGDGIADISASILQPYKTYIMIGSSGVGKSSLLNSLTASDSQKISSMSELTSKGKHTTTTRDLFKLPNGSLLIDSPGMREFGVTTTGGQANDDLFPVIDKFASGCRFTDCKHLNESGCAVLDALQTGALDAIIYDSYVKLMKEQKRFEIRIEDKKRLGKQAGKMSREANKHRKKNKF